jgi:formylglycine-generating enzyme required for sulfatase activity
MKPLAAQVGRADLLRALALHERQQLTLSADEQHWLGYQWQAPTQMSFGGGIASIGAINSIGAGETMTLPPDAAPLKQPLRMDDAWLVKQAPRDDAAAEPEGSAAPSLQPLDEAAAAAAATTPQARQDDLLPWARLLPVLRRHLSQARGGEVDMPRLLNALTSQQTLHHLPRVQRRRWNPDLIVALDFGPAMTPYRTDLHRLCHQLLREVGRTGLSLRLLMHGPHGGWTDWIEEQACRPAPPARHAWQPPAAGSCVLLVSDLGQFQHRPEVTAQWLRWVRLNQAAQVQVLALTPLGAGQLQPQVARQLPVLRWSPDSRLHPERPTPPDAAPGLADLLAMLAATRRVDAPLLRALRRLNPQQPLNAGLEGVAWNHPDVQAGRVCTVQPQHQAQHLAHWRSLPPALLARQQAARSLHHQHLRAMLRHEENLLHATQARLAAGGDSAISPEEQAAIEFLQRLCLTLDQGDPNALRQWLPAVQELLQRLDDSTARDHAALLSRLLAVTWQHAPAAARDLPTWTDVHEFQRASQRSAATPVSAYVVQDFAQQQWRLQPQPPGPGQDGRVITSSTGALLCRTGEQARWLSLHTPQVLGSLEGLEPLTLETPAERWVLTPVQRPVRIAEWRRKKGLELEVVLQLGAPEGSLWNWGTDQLSAEKPVAVGERWRVLRDKTAQRTGSQETYDWGMDEFGVYWDLDCHGVTQRLRYIAPGSFLMGSTLAEQEAAAQGDKNWLQLAKEESPVHQVTLTQGYWLADTACTQALWLAVVGGENPSDFKEDMQSPVEKVSWDDVNEKFLPQLQALLPPGCEAVLPTEAQWEYACRAGTTTPFNLGDNIDPSLVNYNGSPKGEYRERTEPVKALPTNNWGLYQMHGNVWEWCWDEKRNYAEGAVVDPTGAIGNGPRILRGGSWFLEAGSARSAYRYLLHRNLRSFFIGFRVALRFKPQGR